MDQNLKTALDSAAKRVESASTAADALHWSQATLNLAHTIALLKQAEMTNPNGAG